MIASLCDEQNDVGLFGHLRSCSTGEERVDNLLYHVMQLNWKLMFFLGGEGGRAWTSRSTRNGRGTSE